LATAKAVDDMMEMCAHAGVVRVYARQSKDRRRASDAAEIRIRAERRVASRWRRRRRGSASTAAPPSGVGRK
jgi:hypothetical protein